MINDRYQWTLPDGSVTPDNPAQSGASTLTLVYNNINRTQSGIYTCTVSVAGVTETAETNVTLDIQCELLYAVNNLIHLIYIFLLVSCC